MKVWGLELNGGSIQDLAQQAIMQTVDYFRALGMPTCLSELAAPSRPKRSSRSWPAGVPSTAPVPSVPFRVLGYEDILAIYRMANH